MWLGLVLLGVSSFRVGEFTVGDVLVLCAGGVVVVKLLVGDRRYLASARTRRSPQLVLVGTIVLLVSGTVSSFGSWDPGASLLVIARLVYLTLAWFWILRAVTPDRHALVTLLRGWRAGVVLISITAALGQAGLLAGQTENAEGRQTAFSGHPNDLAGLVLIALPIVVLGVPARPGTSRRRALLTKFGLAGLVLYAITTTGSMTGLACAGVAWVASYALTALFPSRNRVRRSPIGTVLIVAGALVGLVVLANSDLPVFERYERLRSGDEYVASSAETRENLNAQVIGSFDKWLVHGVGLDSESVYATGFFHKEVSGGIHNMYLKVLLEAGLPALVGLLSIIVATLRTGVLLVINTRNTALHPIAVALTASTIAVCAFAGFGPILYQRYFWLPIAFVWCLWAVRREELRAAT